MRVEEGEKKHTEEKRALYVRMTALTVDRAMIMMMMSKNE